MIILVSTETNEVLEVCVSARKVNDGWLLNEGMDSAVFYPPHIHTEAYTLPGGTVVEPRKYLFTPEGQLIPNPNYSEPVNPDVDVPVLKKQLAEAQLLIEQQRAQMSQMNSDLIAFMEAIG